MIEVKGFLWILLIFVWYTFFLVFTRKQSNRNKKKLKWAPCFWAPTLYFARIYWFSHWYFLTCFWIQKTAFWHDFYNEKLKKMKSEKHAKSRIYCFLHCFDQGFFQPFLTKVPQSPENFFSKRPKRGVLGTVRTRFLGDGFDCIFWWFSLLFNPKPAK